MVSEYLLTLEFFDNYLGTNCDCSLIDDIDVFLEICEKLEIDCEDIIDGITTEELIEMVDSDMERLYNMDFYTKFVGNLREYLIVNILKEYTEVLEEMCGISVYEQDVYESIYRFLHH